MGFRDENEALRARIQTLESEKERLAEEKERLAEDKKRLVEDKKRLIEDKLAKRDEDPEPVLAASKSPDVGSILAHMAKRNAKEQAALQRASSKELKIGARLKTRRPRVHIESVDRDKTFGKGGVVTIARSDLRDRMRQDWELSAFMFVMPGAAVMFFLFGFFSAKLGLSFLPALVGAVVTWTSTLALFRMLVALWKSPSYRLEIADGHFALYKRWSKPVLLGKLSELKILTKRLGAMLYFVRLSDGRSHENLDLLTNDDARKLGSLQQAIHAKSDGDEV